MAKDLAGKRIGLGMLALACVVNLGLGLYYLATGDDRSLGIAFLSIGAFCGVVVAVVAPRLSSGGGAR